MKTVLLTLLVLFFFLSFQAQSQNYTDINAPNYQICPDGEMYDADHKKKIVKLRKKWVGRYLAEIESIYGKPLRDVSPNYFYKYEKLCGQQIYIIVSEASGQIKSVNFVDRVY